MLPFGELAWEDFERLCLRLARREGDVLHCQLYGTAGQNQDGIDLYARLATADEFRVYQCKRENEFGPAKIQEAVRRFLSGKWAKTAKTLILCTKESLVPRQRADELEKQRDRLKKEGVGFFTWDSEELSTRLKDHADLVDDFFGRAWVIALLGQTAADLLGHRFDTAGVTEYRLKLGVLYRRVFARHDPGFPIGRLEEGDFLDLSERYVIPDVLVYRDVTAGVPSESSEGTATPSNETTGPGLEHQDPRSTKISRLNEPTQVRTSVEAWLRSARNLLLIGSPGSGKSSLLRYLATDLLTKEPVLATVAERWGTYLPVWVSFPLWAELVAQEGQEACSLSTLLRRWLKSWDEERLWPLLEKALSDDRLLLLVDGLDEWTNDSAARVALQRLEVFVAQRGVPSVAVSRPHGLMRIGTRPAGWITGTLAGFTREQQRQLAFAWFGFREAAIGSTSGNRDEAERQAGLSTYVFLEELGRSPDLTHLAENPLLLTLLVFHRIHNVRLPQTRFKAYESLVEHLLAIHPQRRRAAATVTHQRDELTESDLKSVLARIAFQIHTTSAAGLILVDDAMRCIETYLRDEEHGLGLDLPNARRLTRWVTDVGETNLGLLVRQSPSELGFLHRTFQEFLAAYHLTRLPLAEQKEQVLQKAILPQWREVILGLVHCSQRPVDVDQLISALQDLHQRVGTAERLILESILGDVAFGDFSSSPRVARELANKTFDLIETGIRMSHREILLSHALCGLSSSRTRELVRERLRVWFPCWIRWRSKILEAMEKWPNEPETLRTLWVGMFDQEPSVKFAAARTLARLGAGDDDLGDRIERLALSCEDPLTRAAGVDALTLCWPQRSGLEGVIAEADRAGHPALRFAAIRARAVLGKHIPSDRDVLLCFADRRANLDFTLRHDVGRLLTNGWSGDPVVKEACLRALGQRHNRAPGVDDEIAWEVLLEGFPGDDQVVNAVIHALHERRVFSGMFGQELGWHLLAKNFSTCPNLIGPVDQWIEIQKEHAVTDVAHAALLGKTEVGKRKLLGMLGHGRFSYWPARSLAEGWGSEDPEVAAAFRKILDSSPSEAGECGHIIPLILREPGAARKKLLDLLQDPNCKHPDLVLHSLRTIAEPTDKEVVDAVCQNGIERPDVLWMDRNNLISILIEGFHGDPRVRELAKESLDSEDPPHVAIARGFGNDYELRSLLRDRLSPLPDQLRLYIAGHLADESPDTEFSRDLLSRYRREEDPSVKCEASLAYYRLLVKCNAVTDVEAETLGKDIVCYGPDHEEQRQAAFCGLATIGRLDKMASARETIGDPRPCSISLYTRSPKPSGALLRSILEHWDSLRETFGEQLLARLSKSPGREDLLSFYNNLAPFTDQYSAIQWEILGSLEESGERVLPLNILQLVSRMMPKSQLLLDACLRMLHIGDDGSDVSSPMAEVGASVLGEHFGGDERILERILAGRGGQHPYHKTVVALAEGWPTHPFLAVAYLAMRDAPFVPRTDGTWLRLVCVAGTVEESLAVFRLFCRASSLEFQQRNWSLRPIQQRLRKDDTFRDAMMSLLGSNPIPSERASAPRLLALARGVDATLRGWCERELIRQTQELPSPEIGHDLVSRVERCVAQSLLDVLIGGGPSGREFEFWFDEW